MAEFMLHKATFRIGTTAALVNLSSYVRSITITGQAEMLDKTAMGSSARRRISGLKDFSVAVEFNQDQAASKVDATLWPLIGSTAKYVLIKAKSSATHATNPVWKGNMLLPSYTPIAGGVGSLATLSVTFNGDGVITRTTASVT